MHANILNFSRVFLVQCLRKNIFLFLLSHSDKCAVFYTLCTSVKKCISKSKECNNVDDCGDMSDELSCGKIKILLIFVIRPFYQMCAFSHHLVQLFSKSQKNPKKFHKFEKILPYNLPLPKTKVLYSPIFKRISVYF